MQGLVKEKEFYKQFWQKAFDGTFFSIGKGFNT